MNSVASKVVGMAAAVACLALVLNRPAGAEDQKKPEVKKETHVVVVRADGETNIADAVKKALDEKLKELPKDVQEQVRKQLEGIKVHQPLKIHQALSTKTDAVKSAKDGEKKSAQQVEVFVIKSDDEKGESKANVKIETKAYVVEGDGKEHTIKVIGLDGEGHTLDLSTAKDDFLKKLKAGGPDQARAIRIITAQAAAAETKAKGAAEKMGKARELVEAKLKHAMEAHKSADGEKKAVAIAIAVDGDDVSAKEITKEFKVNIKDGKVFINGKPAADLKDAGKKQIRVEIQSDAKVDVKKAASRKLMFMGKDGKAQEFTFEVDVDVERKADKDAAKEGPHAVWIQKLQGLHDDNAKKEIRVRALQLGAGGHAAAPHKIHVGQVDKAHADVTKRLKSIESELKKIRQLLQKMQDDDDDDEEEEEEDEHEHEHAAEHDHDSHDHEHDE